MKINVEREHTKEGNLVFTVTVSEPHLSWFDEDEKKMMLLLDNCKNHVCQVDIHGNKTRNEILSLIHTAKEKTFSRVLENLKFSIENEFRPKFKPICQEIYNWIYDKQTDMLKKWMMEFDPQRTKYYFDNDNTPNKFPIPQESEHDEEDEEEDDQ